jgi:hypothetical protein
MLAHAPFSARLRTRLAKALSACGVILDPI